MGIRVDTIPAKSPSSESKKESVWNRELTFSFDRFNDKKKFEFYTELALMLKSGVDVRVALEIMAEDQQSKILTSLLNNISLGCTFSQALFEISGASEYEVQVMRIGEETGRLQLVMEEAAEFFKSKVELKRQLTGLLTYPLLVLGMAIAVTYFMLIQVVPMFEQIFRSFDGQLPGMTLLILRASGIIGEYGGWFLLISLAITTFLYFKRRSIWFRKWTAEAMLHIPVVKGLIRKVYLARFTRTAQLMIAADIPMNRIIEMIITMIDFYPMEHALRDTQSGLINGKSLNACLSAHPRMFEKRFCSLVRVSEELNQLDEMFLRLSEQYRSEVRSQSEVLGKVAEPLLIVLIALFVGVVLIAMYLPLFKMSEVIL